MVEVDTSMGAEQRDTIVIGGGQAGLAMSYLLTQQRRDHLVLEKGRQIGESWRGRWDSFTLVTPNWQLQLPGLPYQGDDPEGFLTRDEVVGYLERYAAMFEPPVRFGVEVTSLEKVGRNGGYRLRTSDHDYEASNVVVAAGTFQAPNVPSIAPKVPDAISQIHSSEYRNPDQVADGGVLVVGSGQSGCQIAQELDEAGRDVFLSTSGVGRVPRRYRGRDSVWWAHRLGLTDETVDDLDSLGERFGPNPHISGKNGGQDINLHEFARDGMTLLGHFEAIRGETAIFDNDLYQNLKAGDQMAATIRLEVDRYVESTGMDVPEEPVNEPQDGYEQEVITELDLSASGIATILWATGFTRDFSWIELPIFDDYGYPEQRQGVTNSPGLYFLGLHWLHSRKSGLFLGVAEDATHVAAHLAGETGNR